MTTTDSDKVIRRVVATGTLKTLSPAHFGAGETRLADMTLILDSDGRPFLPGSSVAGCVYSRLYAASPDQAALMTLFGGGGNAKDPADQSLISFDDICFIDPTTEHRDGVGIEAKSGTAAPNRKFDLQVLSKGAVGEIRIELVLREKHIGDQSALERAFQMVLDTLARGRVRVGARTRRGYGRVDVGEWAINDYPVGSSPVDALAWLKQTAPPMGTKNRIIDLKDEYRATTAVLTVGLHLDSSLLVRSAPPEQSGDADFVQLRSANEYVIPGTTWAGVLRGRAVRILNTTGASPHLVDELFGPLHTEGTGDSGEHLWASRVTIDESTVQSVKAGRQTRIKINRFTGGTTRGALFEEEPVWPCDAGSLNTELRLELERPEPHEIGLLLLLVKDLCCGDITVGGGAGIGRGAMRGLYGELRTTDGDWKWSQKGLDVSFELGDARSLEKQYGGAWRAYVKDTSQAAVETGS